MTGFFEGRALNRRQDDVEGQGLAFDLGTIENRLSRRKLLGMLTRVRYCTSAFDDSHRQIAAAVARLSDSADP